MTLFESVLSKTFAAHSVLIFRPILCFMRSLHQHAESFVWYHTAHARGPIASSQSIRTNVGSAYSVISRVKLALKKIPEYLF
jgi:hypothetical protein